MMECLVDCLHQTFTEVGVFVLAGGPLLGCMINRENKISRAIIKQMPEIRGIANVQGWSHGEKHNATVKDLMCQLA